MKNLGPQFEVKGGILKLFEDDENNFVALKASATLAGDITFTLPVAMPAVTGYVLSSTTAGVMSWVVNGSVTPADLTAGTGLAVSAGSGTGALLVAATLALSAGSITSLGLADTSVQPARQIISGNGLTGGGDLSADRTLAVGAGTGITVNANDVALANTAVTPDVYGSASQSAVLTIDQQGRITLAADATIAIPASQVNSGATLTAGNGLTGTTAAALLTAATLAVGAGTGITVAADSVAVDQSFAPDWTGFHSHQFNGMGVTPDDAKGVLLYNATAAAAGAQQISPALRFSGKGWKTDATAASRDVSVREWLLPIQGAANPSGVFKWQASINGGAYSDILTVTTAGILTAVGGLNVLSSVGANSLAITDSSGNISGLGNTRGTIAVGGPVAWTTLALGSVRKVLTSDGTDAVWQNPGGTFVATQTSISSSVTVTQAYHTILVDMAAAGANVVVTLPTGLLVGTRITVKKMSSHGTHALSVVAGAGASIDPVSSAISWNTPGPCATFEYETATTTWWIIDLFFGS